MIASAVVVGAWLAVQGGSCAAPFGPRGTPAGLAGDPSLSLLGVPGTFDVPAAVVAPPSSVAVSYNDALERSGLPGPWRQRSAALAFEFLPGLTVSARGAVIDDSLAVPILRRLRDLSANAHYLVAPESGWRPALAIGAIDISGANDLYNAKYAVATKTWRGRVRATAGYARGELLHGPVGSVAVGLCSWLTAAAEFDGRDVNYGARLSPFPRTFARWAIAPVVDVIAYRDGRTVTNVGLRAALPGSPLAGRPAGPSGAASGAVPVPAPTAAAGTRRDPVRTPAATPGSIGSASVTADALARALDRAGFENLRVAAPADTGGTLRVAYENRVYWWDEWDALGTVLGEIDRHATPATRDVEVTVLRLDLPVLTVRAPRAALRAFLDGTMPADAFAAAVSVGTPADASWVRRHRPLNRSAGRLDLALKPRVETLLMTETSVAEARTSLLPQATAHLARGVTVTAQRAVEVHRTDRFWTQVADPNADRLLLNIAGTYPAATGGVAQMSIGRLGHREVGVLGQVDAPIAGARGSVSAMGAWFGETWTAPDRSVALGAVRWRDAARGLTGSLTAGRFLNGDVGAAVALQRLFDPVEVAFDVRATSFQTQGGLRVTVPLGPRRNPSPAAVRVTWPGYHNERVQSTVFSDIPVLRRDVGLVPETGVDVVESLRVRDRLHGPVVLAHLRQIRAAALRSGEHGRRAP